LDNGPLSVCRDQKTVKVNLKTVSYRVVVDSRGQAAGAYQRLAVKTMPLREQSQLARSIPRKSAATTANVQTQLISSAREPAFQSPHHGSSDPGRMPIHPHDRAESLKPEWIAESREKCGASVIVDDCFSNRRAQNGHSLRQPFGDAPAVKRKVRGARAFHGWDYIPPKGREPSPAGNLSTLLPVMSWITRNDQRD